MGIRKNKQNTHTTDVLESDCLTPEQERCLAGTKDNQNPKWTTAEEEGLRRFFRARTTTALAEVWEKAFGVRRSCSSIAQKAARLGIVKGR